MANLKQISRNEYHYGDYTFKIISNGRNPNLKNFTGRWQYSPKHMQMLPHQEYFKIYMIKDKKETLIKNEILDQDINYFLKTFIRRLQE